MLSFPCRPCLAGLVRLWRISHLESRPCQVEKFCSRRHAGLWIVKTNCTPCIDSFVSGVLTLGVAGLQIRSTSATRSKLHRQRHVLQAVIPTTKANATTEDLDPDFLFWFSVVFLPCRSGLLFHYSPRASGRSLPPTKLRRYTSTIIVPVTSASCGERFSLQNVRHQISPVTVLAFLPCNDGQNPGNRIGSNWKSSSQ